MNIFKRIYNWVAAEIQMIYEDIKEGYLAPLEIYIVLGSISAIIIITTMYLTGTSGDMGL
jgi:hypothetical protein